MGKLILRGSALSVSAVLLLAPFCGNAASFPSLIRACAPGVQPETMTKIVRQESDFRPWAIHINGDFRLPRQPRNEAEAIATAQWLSVRDINYDAGLAQVNVANFARLGVSPETIFFPCLNLRAGAAVLAGCNAKAAARYGFTQAAARAGVSCYNTGNFHSGLRNGYVLRVADQVLQVPALLPWHHAAVPVIRDAPHHRKVAPARRSSSWFSTDQGSRMNKTDNGWFSED